MNSTIMQYAWMIPHILACVAGLALVIVNWSRHPMASLLAFFGLGLTFLGVVSAAGVNLLVRNASSDSVHTWITAAGLLRSLVGAGGILMLICAVYAGRRPDSGPVTASLVPPSGKPY